MDDTKPSLSQQVPDKGQDAAGHGESNPGLPVDRRPPFVPAVEQAIEATAYSNPSLLIRIQAMLIGRVLRRSVAEWLQNLVGNINYRVLRTFSLLGLRWRWEAFRSGRTFDEILAEHQVLRRVEQVFLIHRESGLLLAEASRSARGTRNGDMVSGMLTAIQDFVHDSFSVRESEQLDSIQVGNVTVWVEQGPLAVLAAVVQGHPPEHFQARFRGVLEHLHAACDAELRAFSGDVSEFRKAELHLKQCLTEEAGRVDGRILPATWAVLAAPLIVVVALAYSAVSNQLRWSACLRQISQRPGVIITDSWRQGNRYFVRGLRDPLAADPTDIFVMAGLNAHAVSMQWEPYQALDLDFLRIRVRRILNPPSTVVLRLDGDVLSASGTAPDEWIRGAQMLSRGLAGVSRFDTSGLIDPEADADRRWRAYVHAVSGIDGVIITDEGREDGRHVVSGLRDPLADDPEGLLGHHGFNRDVVLSRWFPYQSLDSKFVLARARRCLVPPADVSLAVRGDELVIEGKATHAWIEHARIGGKSVAGIHSVNMDGLVDLDLKAVQSASAQVERHVFKFLVDTPDLWPGQARRIGSVVADINTLLERTRTLEQPFTVEVRGHTHSLETPAREKPQSEELARRFVAILSSLGIDAGILKPTGAGTAVPAHLSSADDPHNRYVSFKVLLP